MARKPKNKAKQSGKNAWLITAAAVVMAGAVWMAIAMTGSGSAQDASNLPQTLDPAQFTGKVREAYLAAKELPEVLAEMPCYCGCMHNQGHENNLFCFRDDHGAHCDMCLNIAIEAKEGYRQGKSVEDIRASIVQRYAIYAP